MSTGPADAVDRLPSRAWTGDTIAAIAVFVVSFAIGNWFTTHWGGFADFYRDSFGPAVSVACGRGFREPDYSSPYLSEFLQGARDSFQCSDLKLQKEPPHFNQLQNSMRYLMYGVAGVWKVRGLAWSALGPLYGFLFATVVVSAFAIFRVAMRRSLALCLTGLIATSPMHLMNLPHLRDYGKAPFVLFLTFLLILLAVMPVRARLVLLLSAVYGALVGVGLGVRTDVEIMLPPFVGVMALFLPARPLSRWPLRVSAIVLCVVTFLLFGWPILSGHGSRGGWFVVDHGLMEPFDEILEVRNDVYGRGHMYHDTFIGLEIQQFSLRAYGNHEMGVVGSAALEKASFGYFLTTVKTFPADMLIRAYASSLKILELPFQSSTFRHAIAWQFGRPEDVRITSLPVRGFLNVRERVLTLFYGTAFWFLLLALFLLRDDWRLAAFAVLAVLYLTTYPLLQFHPRHYFHLEFIGWFAVGLVIERALRWQRADVRGLARHALIVAVFFVVIIVLPLVVARVLQKRTLIDLFERYQRVPATALPLTQRALSNNRVIFSAPATWPASRYVHYTAPTDEQMRRLVSSSLVGAAPEDFYHSELLRLTFDPRAVRRPSVTATVRYSGDARARVRVGYEPSLRINVPLPRSGDVEVIVPIHEVTSFSRFDGIEMTTADAPALTKIEYINDPNQFPMMVRAVLTGNWRERRLYQTLSFWTPNPFTAVATNIVRPDRVVNQSLDGWVLIGYDLEPAAIDRRTAGTVKLHWRAPRDARLTAGANLDNVGGAHWVQTVRGVRNMIGDGGFELDASLHSFPVDIYQSGNVEPLGTTRSLEDDRNSGHGWVASLRHPTAQVRSSYATAAIDIEEDHFYLQATDVRCTTCASTIGREWLPSGFYNYVIPLANPLRWATYGAVTRPVAGSTSVQVWLLNSNVEGEANFDNVIFADLGPVVRTADNSLPPIQIAPQPPAPIPRFPIDRFIEDWKLVGYDTDVRKLSSGEPVDVTLHWRAPEDAIPHASPTLRPCGGQCWLQTVHGVKNVIPNGNFVRGDISFFATNLYGNSLDGARVYSSSSGGYVDLANGPGRLRSSLISQGVPIAPGSVYLQTATLLSTPDARLYYGRAVLPSQVSSFVRDAGPFAPRQRTDVGDVFLPSAGSTHAQIWVLNVDATGSAQIRDVAFAELGRVVPCNSPNRHCGPPIAISAAAEEAAKVPPPQTSLEYEINGWQLLGFDQAGSRLKLHWRAPSDAAPADAAGAERVPGTNRWFQTVDAINLVGDRAITRGGGPLLFPGDLYGAPVGARRFVRESGSKRDIVASLRNDSLHPRSSLVSIPIPATGDHLYLQSGAIHAPSGQAYLGRQWLPGNESSYAANAVQATQWQEFRGVVAAPKGANSLNIWLLNLAPSSEAQFDDLKLIDLGSIVATPGAFPLKAAREALLPDYWLSQAIGDWTLAGFSDKPLRLFWIPPAGASMVDSRLRKAAGRMWMQTIGDRTNLIANGDFESGDLSFFPADIYGSAGARAVIDSGDASRGHVAALRNSPQQRRTSFVSQAVPVDREHLYLQTGLVRSSGGAPFAGRQWLPSAANSYALSGWSDLQWSLYAQALVPPAETTALVVWLLNVDADGSVEFDDVSIRDLGRFDATACSATGADVKCRAPIDQ